MASQFRLGWGFYAVREITAECFRRDMLAATCFAANLLQLSSCLAVSEISTGDHGVLVPSRVEPRAVTVTK